MRKHCTIISLIATMLTACGQDDSNRFTSYTVDGTLTSTYGSGEFNYTVMDDVGNTKGTATMLGESYFLHGYVNAQHHVYLQFKLTDDANASRVGLITGHTNPSGMSGTFDLSTNSRRQVQGTVSGSNRSGNGGDTQCSTLSGLWVSEDTYHTWEIATRTIVIKTRSSNIAGATQITYLNYTKQDSTITYYITRAAVTGAGANDYDSPVDPPKGPYNESFTLNNCKLSIGGKTYSKRQ